MNTRIRLSILSLAMLASAPAWAVTGGTTSGATGGVTQQDTTNNNLASGNGATTNVVSQYQTAVGAGAGAFGTGATALGGQASAASGANTTALGYQATTSGSYSTAVGAGAAVSAPSGTALGAGSTAGGNYTTAVGQGSFASGTNSVAIGQGAQASYKPGVGQVGYQGTAIGSAATSTGINSVALGYASTDGGAANVVSIGSSTQTREIINVSAGTTGTSAVNVNQLNAAIAGVSSSAGAAQYTSSTGAPQTTPSNTATLVGATSGQTNGGPVTLANVGNGAVSSTSLDAVNGGQLYTVNQLASQAATAASAAQSTASTAQQTATSAQATAQNAGSVAAAAQTTATTAQSTAGQALAVANNSAQYTAPGALGLKSNGGAGTLVQNVAAGQAATDAANVGQVQAAAAGAVTTANSYTTQQIQALQSIINNATASGLCKYNGQGGIVCGANTTAAASAVAQGDGASAGYAGSLAIGQGATITAPTSSDGMTTGAVAIGFGARANADPATAIGYQANAAGANSVALGYAATANGSNSVALGAQSVANRPASVSVGDAATGLQRQITNVAPGTALSDAATVGQVAGMVSQATTGILSQANAHADSVAAMAAAVSTPPRFGPLGYSLTAGVAGVGSASAMGVSFAHAFEYHDHPAYWSAGVGFNGGSGAAMVKVGASIGW
jgi:autotransporter adhesin